MRVFVHGSQADWHETRVKHSFPPRRVAPRHACFALADLATRAVRIMKYPLPIASRLAGRSVGRSVGQAGSSHFPAGTPADASHQRVQPPAARRDVSATLLENIFSFEIRHVLLFETIFFSSQIFHQM